MAKGVVAWCGMGMWLWLWVLERGGISWGWSEAQQAMALDVAVVRRGESAGVRGAEYAWAGAGGERQGLRGQEWTRT